MIDFKQEYLSSPWKKPYSRIKEASFEIKGINVKFSQIEPNYWVGEIISIPKQWFLDMVWKDKFQAKQNMIGFWQVWYYNTNKLVFDYEFKTLEDIVNLIDFNIRLGIKY